MYRCKDCGKEYLEKIDYCDCGNNTFDYIDDNVPVPKSIKKEKQPLSLEQKYEIISRIFFAMCLVLSTIIWFIPVKTEQSLKAETKDQKIDVKTIPNIEKIWDDTPPKIETVQKQENVKDNDIITLDKIREELPDKLLKKPIQSTPESSRNILQPKKSQNKKQQVNQPKTTSQTKPANTKLNNVSSQQKITNQPKQETSQTQPITQNKQISNPNNLKPKISQNQQLQNKQSQIAQDKPVQVYNPNSTEMLKYKGSLRAALFAKLPLASVQGSGSCTVQFAVDNTGKLINRAFSKQSDNKSLNDAVYYMLMSVPRFASPPEGYNQELIKMNITMDADGSYEISIQ